MIVRLFEYGKQKEFDFSEDDPHGATYETVDIRDNEDNVIGEAEMTAEEMESLDMVSGDLEEKRAEVDALRSELASVNLELSETLDSIHETCMSLNVSDGKRKEKIMSILEEVGVKVHELADQNIVARLDSYFEKAKSDPEFLDQDIGGQTLEKLTKDFSDAVGYDEDGYNNLLSLLSGKISDIEAEREEKSRGKAETHREKVFAKANAYAEKFKCDVITAVGICETDSTLLTVDERYNLAHLNDE
ncbi:hypothetical protein ES707_12305 [subsurface metagenome]